LVLPVVGDDQFASPAGTQSLHRGRFLQEVVQPEVDDPPRHPVVGRRQHVEDDLGALRDLATLSTIDADLQGDNACRHDRPASAGEPEGPFSTSVLDRSFAWIEPLWLRWRPQGLLPVTC
jgi:hypothetical protein